jgi:uncharacterized damage-inducible protein DinB
MTAVERVADYLTRAIEEDPWQGPSLREILEGVSAADAASHPVPGAHSIWELLHHVTAWVEAVHQRVLGNVCELEGEADWPPVGDTSERAWAQAFENLRAAHATLLATLRTLADADLDASVPNRDYDRAHLLHGLTQHHAYHGGQMALIKRALQPRAGMR